MGARKEDYVGLKGLDETEVKKILQFTAWRLDQQREWNKDSVLDDLKALIEKMDVKLKKFMIPLVIVPK